MSKNHTPGPWKYVIRPERFRIEDDPGNPAIADVYAKAGNGEANARLIAAAPELLAACEEALVWADNDGLKKRLYIAIAKAKGENSS